MNVKRKVIFVYSYFYVVNYYVPHFNLRVSWLIEDNKMGRFFIYLWTQLFYFNLFVPRLSDDFPIFFFLFSLEPLFRQGNLQYLP